MSTSLNLFSSHPQFETCRQICKELAEAGFVAYLAGGCVRDMLLGRQPHDFDIATSATPEQIEQLFVGQTVPVGKQFGVMIVRGIEVATFRDDGLYVDGRRPESIRYSDARRDAERRDFTVNAMFYDLQTAQVIDFVRGQEDLANKKLRAVGDTQKRFAEDHLRVLRGVRFVAQLGFEIEASTWQAICDQAHTVSTVSRERVFQELDKLLMGDNCKQALELLLSSQVLQALLPAELCQQIAWTGFSAESRQQITLAELSEVALQNAPSCGSPDGLFAESKLNQDQIRLLRWCDFFLWTMRLWSLSVTSKTLFYQAWVASFKMPKDLHQAVWRALLWVLDSAHAAELAQKKSWNCFVEYAGIGHSQSQDLIPAAVVRLHGWVVEAGFDLSQAWGMVQAGFDPVWQDWLEQRIQFLDWRNFHKPKALLVAADLQTFCQDRGLVVPRGEDLGLALRFCYHQQLLNEAWTRDELLQSYLERLA